MHMTEESVEDRMSEINVVKGHEVGLQRSCPR